LKVEVDIILKGWTNCTIKSK